VNISVHQQAIQVIPAVPANLIRYVCGYDDYDEFLRSGAESLLMFDLAARKHSGKSLGDFTSILDFGCGAGRLLRFIEQKHSIDGCDIHPDLVEYCRYAFPRANFYQNDLNPPLKFDSGSFDLVYSFSVFSHLSLVAEEAWLAELARVGRAGCLYLLTVQGDWMIEATLGEEVGQASSEGFYFKKVHGRFGGKDDFPEYYESSYHTSAYIRENWSKYFDIVDVIKGDQPDRYLFGDMNWVPVGNIPRFRPMGQDLVVAYKR
jgi:SAM-dependent methyltransferase